MKIELVPTKKIKQVEQEVRGFFDTLDEPFTTTRRMLLLGSAVALLGGIVIGFLCAPDRTRNVTFGSNNTNNGSGNGAGVLPTPADEDEDEDEDDEIPF